MENCSARILGIARQGDTTTLVVFGPGGGPDFYKQAETSNRIDVVNESEAELNFLVSAEGVAIEPGEVGGDASPLVRDAAIPDGLP